MPNSKGQHRCLALHGGGIRGLFTARILAFIEHHTGRRICDQFDLVCGSSTGAILACGLTKPAPITAMDAIKLYHDRGKQIFSASAWQKLKGMGNAVGPKYDGTGLRAVLKDTFGDAALDDALVPTFATGFNITDTGPMFFRSWKPAATPSLLVDVCMASAAGPTYFPPAWVHGKAYVDGGTICNNPALSGLIETCMVSKCHTRDVLVLSVGTGKHDDIIDERKAAGWGNLQWVQPVLDITTDGVSDLTHYQLQDLLPDENYLQLQAALPAEHAAMDDTRVPNLQYLTEAADRCLASNFERLLALLDRLGG